MEVRAFGLLLVCLGLALCAPAQSIDGIVAGYWKGGLPAPVSDAVFARRIYLDVWGLLPTPEQLDEFQRATGPRKREALVGALLANRRNYAAHWITFWNDHLRNDQGVVYHGERKSITPWLKRALEENLPYDRFVEALLNPEEKTGPDGFLIGVNWRGDISASQIPAMQAAQNSAQIFLGVNLKCNSCHDSFISRWKLKDAYGLASYFSTGDLEIFRCDVATGEKASPRFLFPGANGGEPAPENRRAEAARLFTSHPRLARTFVNRVWKTLFGRGLVAAVDDMDARPWSEELLAFLAADFAAGGYDIERLLRTILVSRTYQLPAAAAEPKRGEAFTFRGPLARRLSAEQFADAIAQITGEWRASVPRDGSPASYARDWELKSTALARALGRPIRDQVATERLTQPTTLQAIELANGAALARMLDRGARRLLGLLPETVAPIYDSGAIAGNPASVTIDLSGVKKLWLRIEDVDTYDPKRVAAGWANAWFHRGGEAVRLADLARASARSFRFRNGKADYDAVTGALGSGMALDVDGFDCFHAIAGVDEASVASDISPRLRFLAYGQEPDREQLIPPAGEPPVARPPAIRDARELARRVYRYAVAREATGAEEAIAARMIAGGAEGLADLLWAVFASPEFQYIR